MAKNAIKVYWDEQNVEAITNPEESFPIKLVFENKVDRYEISMNIGNARWLSSALKKASKLSKCGKD